MCVVASLFLFNFLDILTEFVNVPVPYISGAVSTLAGGGGSTVHGYMDGVGAVATFYYPFAISAMTSGDLVIADTSNNIIRRMTSSGSRLYFLSFSYLFFSCFFVVVCARNVFVFVVCRGGFHCGWWRGNFCIWICGWSGCCCTIQWPQRYFILVLWRLGGC